MPEVLDWQRAADSRAVVRRATEALRAGAVVAFPTETGYHLAASALAPTAAGLLREARAGTPDAPLPLALRGAAEACDWAPGMGPLGQRLARRFWPGPVTLECGEGVADGLAGRLPDAVREEVCPQGRLRMRSPAHEAVLATLGSLAGPMLLAPAPGDDVAHPDAAAGDAAQVVRAVGDRVAVVIDGGPTPGRQPATIVQVEGGSWKVVRPGVVSDDAVRRQAACVVIFVCTGNTCRSPLAEGLFKARLAVHIGCAAADLPERGYHVLSAGMAAMSGGPAADEAVAVARSYGADLTGHRSRALAPDLAAQADYLIAMTRGHLLTLVQHYHPLAARPRLLNPAGYDLPDPVGCPQAVYEECARQIWDFLEPLVQELRPPASNAAANT